MTIKEQLQILERGVVEIVPEGSLEKKLIKAEEEKRPLIVKLGADPSAPDIHLGHTVVLRKLKDFQVCGHQVVFLIGDFTGMIGDPTGKSKTRKPLTREQVTENAKSYEKQIYKILDPNKTKIVFNSHWNAPMTFEDVIKLTSKVTVAQMLERDDFQKRYQKGEGISLTEFLYSLIQGYDSVELKADVELGGTDQKFNLLIGRSLQKEHKQGQQVCLMMPLLEGLDGVNKMSKSLNNYIGIDETPTQMFGKVMSITDEMIEKYFTLLTDLPIDEIEKDIKDMQSGTVNPRDIKMKLGKEIIKTYYTDEEAEKAKEEFKALFSKRDKDAVPDDIPEFTTSEAEIWIVKLLVDSKLRASNSEARRLIKEGGFKVNNEVITDEKFSLKIDNGMIIRAGKKKWLKIIKN